jgi:hypothetical protein
MSRRRGQDGSIEDRNGKWTVRYWLDVPGQNKRDRPRHLLGPSRGPGKLTYSEARRLAREFIASTGADSTEHLQKVQAASTGTTFVQQAERWLAHMRDRKRKPTSPKTTDDWEYTLGKWLNPDLGQLPLYAVTQKVVAALVVKMTAAGLAPKGSRKNNFTVVV